MESDGVRAGGLKEAVSAAWPTLEGLTCIRCDVAVESKVSRAQLLKWYAVGSMHNILYKHDRYLINYEENEARAKHYATGISKSCKHDSDCSVEYGHCCITYHFNFCGSLDEYPAKGLRCAGLKK